MGGDRIEALLRLAGEGDEEAELEEHETDEKYDVEVGAAADFDG